MFGFTYRDFVQFNARLGIMLGLVGIGAALGFTFGLDMLQSAAIAEGVFPPPGATIGPGGAFDQPDGPLWDAAKRMQQLANASGGIGAVLLVWGGALDRFENRVVEAIAG